MSDKHDEMATSRGRQLTIQWWLDDVLISPLDFERFVSALDTALRQVERETLERAAKMCESKDGDAGNWSIRYRCAQTIRAINVSTANELPTTQELADVSTPVKLIDREQSDGYVRVPRLKLTETDQSLDMHISNITRREARDIAEMLGGGAVVWHEDRCYPTTDVECTIQAAEKGE